MDRAARFSTCAVTADGGGSMMAGGHVPDATAGAERRRRPRHHGRKLANTAQMVRGWYQNFIPAGWINWGEPHGHVGSGGLVRETEWKLTKSRLILLLYDIRWDRRLVYEWRELMADIFSRSRRATIMISPMDEMGRRRIKYFPCGNVFARHLAPR